ncbi:protein kinase domain-containing protein [Amphritea balenae]|uniref:Serine/threonine protein kinase n=1 Tax=Amphritea balenae TaxID=452629 RepID=A0A3P1SP68_9GAMM|nr:protein kinase [Amphritea balenae]RRC98936.1 serine/threonine protein kinase [Amphritea balenae]GGK63032.1 serine/threonine protein kinase [Amphritea balenae]
MDYPNLQQFYIPEEQSIYLLSHDDAKKLKDWVNLCQEQLEQLGYTDISMIGKGAFGFVFGGTSAHGRRLVFKFSRITLPQHIQDRLEEEAFILGEVEHGLVPQLVEFQRIRRQAILVMERAKGMDLEQFSLQQGKLSPRLVVHIAAQMVDILQGLRSAAIRSGRPLVHGDIKPSNIVIDPETEAVALIDWGSSVFAQLDTHKQFVSNNVMELMSGDLQNTNARLGDVYFIGEEQLNGALSSPRFDEQGLAGTLYALASGQSCRFGHRAIPPTSLGLPLEFARVLENLLDENPDIRAQAGDYLLNNMASIARTVMVDLDEPPEPHLIPVWSHTELQDIDTVAYTSRKAFLKEEGIEEPIQDMDEVQFDRYYKNFLQGMGETEKAFLASISRLAKYPVVGGIAVRWEPDGVYIDSCLNLNDDRLKDSFITSVNNMVNLSRAIYRQGVFKSCLFNAKDTLHMERENTQIPFQPVQGMQIPYEVSAAPELEDQSRMHSYFEDGKDPEEFLELPQSIIKDLELLNQIHHTGLIIFESLPTHLKIHSYYRLLDPSREGEFSDCLARILAAVPQISGLGISGYMKMPYRDTRFFSHIDRLPEKYYPKNPKQILHERQPEVLNQV